MLPIFWFGRDMRPAYMMIPQAPVYCRLHEANAVRAVTPHRGIPHNATPTLALRYSTILAIGEHLTQSQKAPQSSI